MDGEQSPRHELEQEAWLQVSAQERGGLVQLFSQRLPVSGPGQDSGQ